MKKQKINSAWTVVTGTNEDFKLGKLVELKIMKKPKPKKKTVTETGWAVWREDSPIQPKCSQIPLPTEQEAWEAFFKEHGAINDKGTAIVCGYRCMYTEIV